MLTTKRLTNFLIKSKQISSMSTGTKPIQNNTLTPKPELAKGKKKSILSQKHKEKILLAGCFKSNKLEKAKEIMERCLTNRTHKEVYELCRSFIQGAIKHSPEFTQETLDFMIDVMNNQKDNNHLILLYNNILEYYIQENNRSKGTELIELIMETRQPNIKTFELTLKFHVFYMPKPQQYFDLMIEKYSLKPNVTIFNLLIHAYLFEKKIEEAIRYFNMMTVDYKIPPTAQMCTEVIQKLTFHGKIPDTLKFMDQIYESFKIQPTHKNVHEIFICSTRKQAIQFYEKLSTYEMKPDMPSLRTFFKLLVEHEDMEYAEKVFGDVTKFGLGAPTFPFYKMMVDGYCKLSNVEKALEYYNAAKERFSRTSDLAISISEMYFHLGQPQKAKEFVEQDPHIPDSSRESILKERTPKLSESFAKIKDLIK